MNADSPCAGTDNGTLDERGAPSVRRGGWVDKWIGGRAGGNFAPAIATSLYLDQNYLSGIAKRKPAFAELEPVLRTAVAAGAIEVLESPVHELESRPRPDLGLLELLRDLSRGRRLPSKLDRPAREVKRRMTWVMDHELPERRARPSDAADLQALALALTHCDLVTCDAFMADVVKRARLDLRHRAELFSGRRRDVLRLREIIDAIRTSHRGNGGGLTRWRT